MSTMPRFHEVRGWLTTRVTAEQAEQHISDLERNTMAALGKGGGWLAYFQKKLVSRFEPGDEFWLYDSGPESWKQMHGEKGIALVRNGQVVAFMMEAMN